MKKQFRNFEDARKIAQTLKIRNQIDWRIYGRSGKLPGFIPRDPPSVYKKDWKGWADWLRAGKKPVRESIYRPFKEAREFVNSLKIQSNKEWRKYCSSDIKPENIPANPNLVYKNKGWVSYGDWLGTGRIATNLKRFQTFEKARKYVRSLELKNQNDWTVFCKSGNKPDEIPTSPEKVFKKEWKGIGDWLGTGRVASRVMAQQRLSYDEAKKFVQTLNLQSKNEWIKYSKTTKKPANIPASPDGAYKNEWKSWGDWLGTGTVASFLKEYRIFEEARKFVHSLGLKNSQEWHTYCKSGNKPDDITASPNKTYKNKGWKSLGDWLGTGTVATFQRQYRSFEEAQKFVHSLGLKSANEWRKFAKSNKKPDDISAVPNQTYKNKGWKSWGDWLGTGTVASYNIPFRDFNEAKKIAQSLGLTSVNEWRKLSKSGNLPDDVPSGPSNTYKNKGWISWGDWLGTETIAPRLKEYVDFNEAKNFSCSLGLKTQKEWIKFAKYGNLPKGIPHAPVTVYKKIWKNWGDWLGTGVVGTQVKAKQWLPYDGAKIIVRELAKKYHIKNWQDWKKFTKSGLLPKNIPTNPSIVYSKKRKK